MPVKSEPINANYGLDSDSTARHDARRQSLKRESSDESLSAAASKVPRTLPRPPTLNGPKSSSRILRKILKEKFGYESFRYEQEAAMVKIMNGENVLAVFPTGAGKSLLYQIPAIAFEEMDSKNEEREPDEAGITVVVSPLIALMKDQVDGLKKKGIAAECIDSTKTWDEQQEINKSLREGRVRILYCAPERLNNETFLEKMKSVKGGIRMVAVDEAHCISEWGHSFRPEYLKVARFVQEIKAERVVCLTATATTEVANDICHVFNINREAVFRTSPYRSNLRLEAKAVREDQKHSILRQFLEENPGSTIVYVTIKKEAEDVAALLTADGFRADHFHSSVRVDDKKSTQEAFMASEVDIIVATIAFGMGIDKSDIRNIVHWNVPGTVEEYCQQIGRAGRDGKPSQCLLFLCRADFYMKEYFARGDLPSRRSVRHLIRDIFNNENVQLPKGGIFMFSNIAQGNEFDMRPSPIGLIYALLELRFKLIRAITPEYTSYKFEAGEDYLDFLYNHGSPEASAIIKYAKKAIKYHSIDLSAVVNETGLRRTDLVNVLDRLETVGAIRLMVSGLRQKYRVMSKLPKDEDEINKLVDDLYEVLWNRETQALDRLDEVVNLITGSACFAHALSTHFGTNLPGDMDECGHCTFCIEGEAVPVPADPPQTVDQNRIQAILSNTDVRDDARFLSRVAFGISSPRVRKLKLQKHPVFGSMADHDFNLILDEFEKVCEEDD